ncbi:MAG: HlyD family efflux transporter periplasmic adaptor subunit [Planctomycetes bacterium]|nr:HlyD family efflux transporter periplasmic adaptor subunit [Planctomycetota bacterium]
MAPQVTQTTSGPSQQQPSAADLIDRLSRFDGPPEMFLVNLLAVQCHLAAAAGGAILRPGPDGKPEVLAVYPQLTQGATAPVWLASAVEAAPQVAQAGQTAVRPLHNPEDLYGAAPKHYLIFVPLRSTQGVRGIAAFTCEPSSPAALKAARERVEITVSLLSLYEMRLTLQRRNLDLQRVRMATETLAGINEHGRSAGASMALCNELASRWQADRVSVGFLKGRYVHLKAMSHTEKFSRKMKLVQDIEAAMEECLDQDVEVAYPAAAEDTYVARATGDLSKRHGPTSVLSLPLRQSGQVRGVLTLERPVEEPFDLEDVEALRLTAELCTPTLVTLHETDRWFGARWAGKARKGLATFLGPKHTWAKLAAIGAFCAIVFLTFAKGQYRVEAPFVFEATSRRVAPAPFDGQLKEVLVQSGQQVEAGTVLARLETFDLQKELARAEAGWRRGLNEAADARAQGETAKAMMAEEQARQFKAEMDLYRQRIADAEIVAPVAGRILTPDLDKLVGGPVERGKVLFELAPLNLMWAELSVDEDQIGDVKEGQRGELAAVGRPGDRIAFRVERITPLAEVVDQRNVFKVRVELEGMDLEGRHRGIYPGAEGIAKIDVDKRHYAWIWTRKLVNWVRMKLWW